MAPMTHSYGCHSCPVLCGLHSNTCPHCTVPNGSQLMMLLSLFPVCAVKGCSPYSQRRKGKGGLSAGVLPALVSHGRILTYRLCDPGQVPNLSELQPLHLYLRQEPALLGVGVGRDCLSTHSVDIHQRPCWQTVRVNDPPVHCGVQGERTVASQPSCQCDRKPGVKVKQRAEKAPGSGEDGTDCISLVKMVRMVGYFRDEAS